MTRRLVFWLTVIVLLFGTVVVVSASQQYRQYFPFVGNDTGVNTVVVAGEKWTLKNSETATLSETDNASVWFVHSMDLKNALVESDMIYYNSRWYQKTYQGIGKGFNPNKQVLIFYWQDGSNFTYAYYDLLVAME